MADKNKYSISFKDLLQQIAQNQQSGRQVSTPAHGASFDKAFDITIFGNEGYYDPGRDEKETAEGIDRGQNPNWPGWSIIDNITETYQLIGKLKKANQELAEAQKNPGPNDENIKKAEKAIQNINNRDLQTEISDVNKKLKNNKALQKAIKDFYENTYWKPLHLGDLNNQQIANNLFDAAVNQGTGISLRFGRMATDSVTMAGGVKYGTLPARKSTSKAMVDLLNKELADTANAAKVNMALDHLRHDRYSHTKGHEKWLNIWDKRLTGINGKPIYKDDQKHKPTHTKKQETNAPDIKSWGKLTPLASDRPLTISANIRHLQNQGNNAVRLLSEDKSKYNISLRKNNSNIKITPIFPDVIDNTLYYQNQLKRLRNSINHPLSLDTGVFNRDKYNLIPAPVITHIHRNTADTTHIQKPQKPLDNPIKTTNIHIGSVGSGLTVKTEMPLDKLEKYIKNVLMKVIQDSGIAAG